MPKKGRITKSMRGEEVNFDLIEIKQQMASQPKSVEVRAREDFIEQRLHRRSARRAARIAEQQLKEAAAVSEEPTKTAEPETSPVSTKEQVVSKTRTRRIKKTGDE